MVVMTDATPDPAASALDGIRERWSKVAYVGLKPEVVPEPGYQAPWLPDVARLIKAAGAALKLAGDWDAESDHLDGLAERGDGDEEGRPVMAGQAIAYHDAAVDLREAITAALAGKEADDGA